MTVPVSIVVAVTQNGAMGRDGGMTWKLSTDLKRFKELTIGKPIVLGRKTLESFGGKPLPGRPHVIITRSRDFSLQGAETVDGVEKALSKAQEIAAETGAAEVCVIGGGEIYRQVMDLVHDQQAELGQAPTRHRRRVVRHHGNRLDRALNAYTQ